MKAAFFPDLISLFKEGIVFGVQPGKIIEKPVLL